MAGMRFPTMWRAALLGLAASACAATTTAAPEPSTPAGAAVPDSTSPATTEASTPEPLAPIEKPAPAAETRSPVPHRPGRCPAPSAATAALFERSVGLAERTMALESHRAVMEAVRMRLDELFQSGCRPSLGEGQLLAEIARIGATMAEAPSIFVRSLDDYTTMVSHATTDGGSVAMYTWANDKVRTRIHVTSDGLDMEQRLLLLDATVFLPTGGSEPLLAIANTHPWTSSCWRTLRFRVLAASDDPYRPTVVLNRDDGGRWCEDVTIQTKGAEVSFHFLDWGGALTIGRVMRPTVLAFAVDGKTATERFGFPPGPEYLVEDWLSKPWSLARDATADVARDRLEATHGRLAPMIAKAHQTRTLADPEELTHELFPGGDPSERRLVVYCALASGGGCPDWPKPVDFVLELESDQWRVRDVKARP